MTYEDYTAARAQLMAQLDVLDRDPREAVLRKPLVQDVYRQIAELDASAPPNPNPPAPVQPLPTQGA